MKFFSMLICLVFAGLPVAHASEPADIEQTLRKAVPQLRVAAISESPLTGLYRVEDMRGQVIYANADGSYFVTGELYSTKGGELVNLSQQELQGKRKEKIAALGKNDKVTFLAKGKEKAHITVFTDIDCGYCRKLHQEVPRMNELGITVSYLAFPRAGVGSSSYDKLVSVWCAEDKQEAMTQAKAGRSVESKKCENPVASEYNLGNALGVTGTPALVLNDGTLVPGYVPAEQLAKGLGIL